MVFVDFVLGRALVGEVNLSLVKVGLIIAILDMPLVTILTEMIGCPFSNMLVESVGFENANPDHGQHVGALESLTTIVKWPCRFLIASKTLTCGK